MTSIASVTISSFFTPVPAMCSQSCSEEPGPMNILGVRKISTFCPQNSRNCQILKMKTLIENGIMLLLPMM
ncbi:MAG: hypothetical protein ACRETW_13290 [Stenotrophobium sp.]